MRANKIFIFYIVYKIKWYGFLKQIISSYFLSTSYIFFWGGIRKWKKEMPSYICVYILSYIFLPICFLLSVNLFALFCLCVFMLSYIFLFIWFFHLSVCMSVCSLISVCLHAFIHLFPYMLSFIWVSTWSFISVNLYAYLYVSVCLHAFIYLFAYMLSFIWVSACSLISWVSARFYKSLSLYAFFLLCVCMLLSNICVCMLSYVQYMCFCP